MGSGLSMASVNKIKELANQREYSLALDILDSQDLSKSLNPQFLRLCGDIYTRMGRYNDARKVLLMAHKMAPEAKRVIFSLVFLYLKVGYTELAKTYYDLYMFDADEGSMETKQLQYIMEKASGKKPDELVDYIAPYYSHNLDYDWSYETYLNYIMVGRDKDAGSLADDYIATFKNTENSYNIEKIRNKEVVVDDFFFVFADEQVEDTEPDQEELRNQEKELLRLDDLRIHPIEAEITIMVDDYDEPEFGTKLKMKKLLKKQRKLDEQAEESEEQKEASMGDEQVNDEKKGNTDGADIQVENVENQDEQTNDNAVKNIIKKFVFKLKKNNDDLTMDETSEEKVSDDVPDVSQVEDIEQNTDISVAEAVEKENDGEYNQESLHSPDDYDVASSVGESVLDNEDFDMQEIHNSKQNSYNSIVSVEVDDDFTAEADTIEGLSDEDYVNPFDSISALKKEKEEHIFVPKRKSEVLFESYDIDSNDDDEQEDFDVDDFSDNSDDGFGVMSTDLDKDYIEEDITEEEELSEEITQEEEIIEEEELPEDVTQEEEIIEEEELPEDVTQEEEITEKEELPEEIIQEEEITEEEELPEEIIQEEEIIEEEELPEEIIQEEEIIEEEELPEEIIQEEEIIEEEELPEEIIQEEEIVKEEELPEEIAKEEDVSVKKKLDFPVFRSSLFPNHNAEKKQTKNNFNAIMTEAQDKIQENILKEEQMQREAEALLASLGIDLDSIVVTPDSIESINKTLYNEPSRDELKASLKIDSVKKNILRKLKEYR